MISARRLGRVISLETLIQERRDARRRSVLTACALVALVAAVVAFLWRL